MKIILLGHRKRQGKDTFATMLADKLPNSVITSFARPMKNIAYGAVGLTFEEGEEKKNTDQEFRKYLQNIGSGAIKDYFGKSVWRDVLLDNLPECDYLIVVDFRFPEEYIEGAITIKIHRDDDYEDTHISETALKDFVFDFTVMNKKELNDLDKKANVMATLLKQGLK